MKQAPAMNNCAHHFEMQGLFFTLKKNYIPAIAGSIFSFILASIIYSGWPNGLIPNISYPYAYSGDALSHLWMIQRILEGWIFENPRGGFPFGSDFSDYPNSDAGNFLLIKIIGFFFGSYYAVLNIYSLLTYALSFFFSFLVFRALSIQLFLAFSLAVIYSFTTFHLVRMGHLFYLAYFVAPIFFYYSLLWTNPAWQEKMSFRAVGVKVFGVWALFAFLAGFGVYYALFGCILLFSAFIYNVVNGFVKTKGNLFITVAIVGIISGVALNMTPYWLYKKEHGVNPEVAQRHISHSEIHGLKLTHLVLPQSRHRVDELFKITNEYLRATPLNAENATATIGFLGAVGLLCAALITVRGMSGRKIDPRLSFPIVALIILFLFGIIGGLGSLFAMAISPSIRGWNRISIFIAFIAIMILGVVVSRLFSKKGESKKEGWLINSIALVIIFVGLFDQVPPAHVFAGQMQFSKKNFQEDQVFFKEIEKSMPYAAGVYQLPYIPFPENPVVHKLAAYDQARGFLNTEHLHWSFASMRGRPADLFYRDLSKQSIRNQLAMIEKMGFSGIFINSLGYKDQGEELISEISRILNRGPDYRHANGSVFFKIQGGHFDPSNKNFDEILEQAYSHQDLDWNTFGLIDFAKENNQSPMLALTSGLSSVEPLGRWSSGSQVRVYFKKRLPERFLLKIKARGLTKNGPKVHLRAGEQIIPLELNSRYENYSFVIEGENMVHLDFVIDNPQSPLQLGIGTDPRKLGIALSFIEVQPLD